MRWLEGVGRLLASSRWRWWWLALWIGTIVTLVITRWAAIHWFSLGDTDDNLRFAQVRALLDGQGWYDLRQYRLDPPAGANIHWTRLVDLPIAGIILLVQPLFGAAVADRAAVAIAPTLALGAALYALFLAVRRLIEPRHMVVLLLAFGILMTTASPMAMFRPLRIDHHGWQLAMLMLAVAGSADPAKVRGGITVGLATAISMSIGLELLPSMAIAGAMIVLRWAWDAAEADRLHAFGVTLAGGCAIGFVIFASNDNRGFVCDALSPVYLSAVLAAGALAVLLPTLPLPDRRMRFFVAAAAGAVLAGAFALSFPQCLARPENLSPEARRLWFDNIREAKPLYQQNWRVAWDVATLPVIGSIGALIALWRAWRTDRFAAWATAALLSLFSTTMLAWQTRYAPGAQLLAVPGATALGVLLVAAVWRRSWWIRGIAAALALVLVTGAVTDATLWMIPQKPVGKARQKVNLANRRCPTLPALHPIAKLPPATILTFIDLGPRIVATTHHSAIAGPYHRNGPAILDIQHSFRAADPEVAHDVMRRHGATLLLICPGLSESTIYATRAPNGLYAQLQRGEVPAWLTRVPLPASSPYKLWRLAR